MALQLGRQKLSSIKQQFQEDYLIPSQKKNIILSITTYCNWELPPCDKINKDLQE